MDPYIHQRHYPHPENNDDQPPPKQYPVYENIRVDPSANLRVPGVELPKSVIYILIAIGGLSFLGFLYLFMGYRIKGSHRDYY